MKFSIFNFQFSIRLFIILISLAVLGGWVSGNLTQDGLVFAAPKAFDADLLPSQDNIYSIGLQPNLRFKDAYVSGNLVVGGVMSVATTAITSPFVVAVGPSAVLQISASSQIFMNNVLHFGSFNYEPTAQNGALYYNVSSTKVRGLQNGVWSDITGGVISYWSGTGNDIFNNNTGNVGIGEQNPNTKLKVKGRVGVNVGYKFPDGISWTIGRNSVFSTLANDGALTSDGYSSVGQAFTIGATGYYLYLK